MVETFPVYVTGSANFSNAQLLWGAKYKRYLYKIQIGCNFLGNIVLWTGTSCAPRRLGEGCRPETESHVRCDSCLLGNT